MSGTDDLEPTVTPSCVVCEGRSFELRCAASELEAQQAELVRFHRARLARRQRGDLDERANFTQDYATDLVVCTVCGLLLRSPRPPAAAGLRAYQEDEYPPERIADLLTAQVASFRGKLAELQRIGPPGRILEVGSFVGGFLEVARAAGLDAVGLDPGQQLAKHCRDRGLRVIEGTLEDLAPRPGLQPFDCVAIWNTFDQLPDPRATLDLSARCLRPAGLLALRVPHGLYFERLLRRFRSRVPSRRHVAKLCMAWNNLLAFPYLCGYGALTLDRLVEDFGFERVRAQGDVLCRLAGRGTAGWARAEERLVKASQRVAIARPRRVPDVQLRAAPWLDLYYRRRG